MNPCISLQKPSSHGQYWVFQGSPGFVTKDWSMHITTTDANGEPLAAAQQHFVVGPPDQDMRAAWRMEVVRYHKLEHPSAGENAEENGFSPRMFQHLSKFNKKMKFNSF